MTGLKNRQSRVEISVINAGPLLTFIIRSSYSSEAKWTYRRSSFGVYFETSKLAYQSLHQSAEYVKRLGDSAVSERTARHWFQKFRSGDLSLCDKARTGRPQALDDEALQAAIGKDSSQTCGELVRQFNTSSEIVRLYVHRLGKTYRLSKWVPHTLLEVLQQREAACLSLHSRHLSASILNRVLISDRKWL
ncbi:histone-lysine N-methyltransferase SETMAR [Trichonephila clavipes]|nr:histone-lysine N-methyltransferase SETMAR [Trichonephila clavipes]